MEFEVLAAELVRALRGKRSQTAFSRRLGCSTNVVYSWESGRRWPTAARALFAAERAGLDVREALRRFYRSPPDWLSTADPTSRETVARLLEDLRGGTAIGVIAHRAGRSRFAVARWLKGTAEPRLPDFLRMVESTSLRLLDFIAQLVDPRKLPSVAEAWGRLEVARRAAYEMPWSHAVLRVLELSSYTTATSHVPGFIAEQLGISLEQEERCLSMLEETRQIHFDGRRYRAVEARAVDTRHDPRASLALKAWWAEQALGRLRAEQPGLFSYNLFTVSNDDYRRLQDLHLAYFRELRSIVADSEPAERVVLANIQLLPLGERTDAAPGA